MVEKVNLAEAFAKIPDAWNPRVVGDAESYLAWVAPSYVALGIGIVLGSVMQGAGAPERALRLDACVVLLLQLPASAFILLSAERTLTQVWLTVACSYVALAAVLFASYRRGRFLRAAQA